MPTRRCGLIVARTGARSSGAPWYSSAWSGRLRLGVSQFRAGQPPTALALVVWAIVAWAVVTVYLPMAWDRYLLADSKRQRLAGRDRGRQPSGSESATPCAAIVRRPETWVFLILIGSYAFFWHTRDWNTASRLMLTYALVDRGTVAITGLEIQTEDKAKFEGQYYCDKFPGFPCWRPCRTRSPGWYWGCRAIRSTSERRSHTGPPITGAPWARRDFSPPARPSCSRSRPASWAARQERRASSASPTGWRRRLTSMPRSLTDIRRRRSPCSRRFFSSGKKAKRPRESVSSAARRLPGGLCGRDRASGRSGVGDSGLLSPGPVPPRTPPARCPGALCRRRDVSDPDPPDLQSARLRLTLGHGLFSSRHTSSSDVHSADNPWGLRMPDRFWQKLARACFWGRYRGLAFYAPILLLAIPGWVVLAVRRNWDVAVVTFSVSIAVLAREHVLSRMDRRLVDRSAAAGSLAAVRDAARGRLALRENLVVRQSATMPRRRPRAGRRLADARVSSCRRADSTRLH